MDLSLGRMWKLLEALGNPQESLPPVVHIAGTNGKGSTVSHMRAGLEGGGHKVHAYTSPHLVRFHERIYIGDAPISEAALTELLAECEEANGGTPVTFFEITTAAAFLAFSRTPADICLLETGLGGRLDATNVVEKPELTVITPVDIDHQQFLGETIEEIAGEKAGIMKRGVPCIVGPQSDAVRGVLETHARTLDVPLVIANQEFQAYEENGRLVYQDTSGLLDLPLPRLVGRFQIENAGTSIAALRALESVKMSAGDAERALLDAAWPARMQLLDQGPLLEFLPEGSDIWVDGGHNASAGRVIAASLAELEECLPRPTVVICGMLNTKTPQDYLMPFEGLASKFITVSIPGEENSIRADDLANVATLVGFQAEAAKSIEDALSQAGASSEPVRVLICGSLYLAGHVLAMNSGEKKIGPSGASSKPGR